MDQRPNAQNSTKLHQEGIKDAKDAGRLRLEAQDVVREDRARALAVRMERRRAAAEERHKRAAAEPPSWYAGVESSRVQAARVE